MNPTDTVRRRLSAAARRERIEAAAIGVFAARGYDATALGEIARAAGVTRTVLYDHFRSKRALYLHVLETQNDAMLAAVRSGITGTGAGPARLRSTIAAYLDFAARHPAARRLLLDPVPSGDLELDAVIASYRDLRSSAVATMLGPDLARSGVADGSAASAVIVALLITGIDGVARWWQEHPEVPLDEVTDIAARLLWSGLPRLDQG